MLPTITRRVLALDTKGQPDEVATSRKPSGQPTSGRVTNPTLRENKAYHPSPTTALQGPIVTCLRKGGRRWPFRLNRLEPHGAVREEPSLGPHATFDGDWLAPSMTDACAFIDEPAVARACYLRSAVRRG